MQGSVEGIDLKRRRVTTSTGGLDFDYLVIALGSVSNIPESVLLEKGNLFTLKTLNDAILIRNHVISIFEQAATEKNSRKLRQLLTFMVAGAGYTGVQMVTELRDFIFKTLVKLYTSIDPTYIRIILVEAESKLMPEMDAHFGAYAFKYLQQTKVETRFNSRVTQVWKDKVQINHLEVVPVSTIIWVAGVVANPQVAALNIAKDNLGRVLVNEYLEVPGFPGVYAVGDCAHFKDIRSGKPVQQRAHTGVRQAKVAAINILADIRGRSKKPYHHSNPVQMVSLGSTKAIFCFGKLRLYGLPARLVWLGAYALLVTGIYNRLRITTDWLLTSVFGRDTNFIKF
jgi:NADH dehydrogenase